MLVSLVIGGFLVANAVLFYGGMTSALIASYLVARPANPDRSPMPFAVVDLETTGLDATADRVVEIAIVEADGLGAVSGVQRWLVKPDDGSHGGEEIHNISREILADSPSFGEIAKDVREALDKKIVVAHNLCFDWSFLEAEFARIECTAQDDQQASGTPLSQLCTLRLAKTARLRPLNLESVCRQLGVDGPDDPHRADADAFACARALSPLLDRLGVSELTELTGGPAG